MGHTVSKSLYWNQDSCLVVGGRAPVVYVCDPVLLLLPLWSIAKHPLLKQRFMEVVSSWEVLLFILLVLGNGCLRYMDGLGLSQHFTIQHDTPDVVVVFAKIFLPSAAKQTQCQEWIWFQSLLCPSEVKVLHTTGFCGRGECPVACEGCATVGRPWGISGWAEESRGGLQAAASVAPCAWEILWFSYCSRNISGFYFFTVKFLFCLLTTLLCSFQMLNLFSWTYSWVISSIS